MKKTLNSFTNLKTVYGAFLLLFLGILTGYSQLLTNVNFNSEPTVGVSPSVGTVSPATPTASNYVYVIDQPLNTAGTGRGIQFFDNSSTVGTQYRLNFVTNSGSVVEAVRFDFSFAALSAGPGTSYIQAGVMGYNVAPSSGNNFYGQVRLYDNAQLRFAVGANTSAYTTNLTANTGYDLSMFVNHSPTYAANYTGPDSLPYVLPAYSVAYWLDGALVISGGLNTNAVATAGLGAVGFGSISSAVNINYALDDIVVTGLPVSVPVTATWSGAGGNDNWSTTNNWSGGLPETNEVFFLDADTTGSSGPFGLANNIVDASLSILSLTYGNTNGFHTTQIPSGSSLTVDGPANPSVFVGTGTDNGSQTVYATILGQGSLLVTNSGGMSVIQGAGSVNGALATFDLEGLDTFTAYLPQIRVAAEGGVSSSSPQFNRPNATLILAKTNVITCTGTPGLRISRTASNGGTGEVKLGQTNAIFINSSIEVGGRKAINSKLHFNPNFTSPTALFRDLAGTGRQSLWTIGDGVEQTSDSGSTSSGTIDFTSGTVDALVDTIIVGRAAGGPGLGILTFDSGTVDVNTLYLGVETTAFAKAGVGTVNVNGTGHLLVNGDLVMGSGGVGGTTTHGALNIGPISGGSVTVNGDIVCASGVGNIINSFGDLTLGGQVGADVATNTPLETLELWLGSLTFARGSAGLPATPLVHVTNLNVNGSVSLVVSGNNFALGQFPLFKYYSGLGDVGGFSGFSGLALTLPGNVDGYLSNHTANASVDLVITNISTKVWSGIVNSVWDINSTANWLKVPPGTSATYQQTSVPGDAVTFNDSATNTTVNLTTTLSPDGIKVNNPTKTYTFNGTGALSGPAGLIKQGAATLILGNSGANDFAGPVAIEGGTVRLSGASDRLPTNNAVTLADVSGASLDLNNLNQTLGSLSGGGASGGNVSLGSGTLTLLSDGGVHAGMISGTGMVIKDGDGAQVLSGANLYSGGTRVIAGTLTVANTTGSGIGSGNVSVETTNATLRLGDGGANGSISVGTITNNGLVVLNRSDDLNFTTLITGEGSFTKENSNTVTIAVVNTYTNTTTVAAGALRISNAGALGDLTGATYVANDPTARLELPGGITLLEPLRVAQKQTAAGNVPGVLNLGGTNTLAGPIELPGGGSYWIIHSDAGALIVTGPTTNSTTSNTRWLWLSGAGAGEWNTDMPDGTATGKGALRKDGTGTWKLGNTVTYTGPTVVSNGTLVVNGTIANSSGVTVVGGTLAGTGYISTPVTIDAAGNLAPGDGGIGTLSVFNSLTLNGTTTMQLAKTGPTVTNDQVSVLTTLTLGGTLDVSLTGTVTGGEVFQLFTAGTIAPSAFSATNLPALPGGLTWDTSNLAAGTLAIAGGSAPTLGYSKSGNVLTFNWTGAFKLQAQTNALSVGLKPAATNWFDYPGGNVSGVMVTNNPANPAVFFRLISQ